MTHKTLSEVDPRIYDLIKEEEFRQREELQMIPSENYSSKAVQEAVGSVLMNKYSENRPHKRYYQGNRIIDMVELLVERRALDTFGLNSDVWSVNVQPYSGTPANLAVFTGLLEPGDTIMPMFLPDGGHLSHGWIYKDKHITLTSKVWNIEFYHVDEETKQFNYEKIKEKAMSVKPKIIVSGGTAYPRDIDHQKMAEAAHACGAYYLADISHEAGLVAAQALGSPFDFADVVTMTTHKTLRGPRGAMIFAKNDLIDRIHKAVFPGLQGGPHNHTIAGIGVALALAQTDEFRVYAQSVIRNAKALAKAMEGYGYDVVSGGTDKHLVLLDLRNKGISGKIPALALEQANIILNFNTVPYDDAPPLYPSGLRMGTPAITSRGMDENDMKKIADWINRVIEQTLKYELPEDKKARAAFVETATNELSKNEVVRNIRNEVKEFAMQFPVPGLDD
ncbi:serine hydroxymethyltransferase [candidate division WWE3 bacterium]|uniref:Serine hydroxymethyltransferase n=1 Tax=candidate division WWE3 bacterium TaxID=2053526 RepID=A0A955LKA8_UNCKA|nr:serine hydroxymethyltransferase [candidate division WWE3 bacterium]